MKRLLLCTALASLAAPAWATEYGRVTSVTPMIQQVPSPCGGPTQSANEMVPCQSPQPTHSQVTGYQIQYRYKGQTYSAQLPIDPGQTIALQFDPNTGNPIPAIANTAQNPVTSPPYASEADPYGYSAPYYAPAYSGPAYYGPAYYGPAYYGGPLIGPPVIGLGFGIGFGGGWHGHGGGHHR